MPFNSTSIVCSYKWKRHGFICHLKKLVDQFQSIVKLYEKTFVHWLFGHSVFTSVFPFWIQYVYWRIYSTYNNLKNIFFYKRYLIIISILHFNKKKQFLNWHDLHVLRLDVVTLQFSSNAYFKQSCVSNKNPNKSKRTRFRSVFRRKNILHGEQHKIPCAIRVSVFSHT